MKSGLTDKNIELMANKAADYLEGRIMRTVKDILVHYNIADTVVVLEMETDPITHIKRKKVIERWWVVTGAKLPTVFTPMDKSNDPQNILTHYLGAVKRWASAVLAQKQPPAKPRIEAPMNAEYAKSLLKVVSYLEE